MAYDYIPPDMSDADVVYNELVKDILKNGKTKENRTGQDTLQVFGRSIEFDLSNLDFPLLTSKKINFKNIVAEVLWYLRGETNIDFLKKHGSEIWTPWADDNGEVGKTYGYQIRSFNGDKENGDQVKDLIEGIKTNPNSRRHIMTMWNPLQLKEMALPPCLCFYQFDVTDGELSLMVHQRSCDVAVGLPYDIATFALLLEIIAWECNLMPGKLIMNLGDTHIYKNHIYELQKQIERPIKWLKPTLKALHFENVFSIDPEVVELVAYIPHPYIKYKVAV